MTSKPTALLEVRSVSRTFGHHGLLGKGREVTAVSDAHLVLPENRPVVVAIAGESGSGKTTLARLMLGMVTPTSGSVRYRGRELRGMSKQQKREFRREVQAIFQDPFEVFNPFYKVDHALTVPVARFFPDLSRQDKGLRVEEGLRAVGLRPEETLGRYPHQLSGGQRQRIMVARALLLDPRIIIADEPVSMVDASLRATILGSLHEIHRDRGISLVYITHDLTTAYQLCRTILVMYRGTVVEVGDVERVIKAPKHPYTQLLVSSIPHPDVKRPWGGVDGEAADQPDAGAAATVNPGAAGPPTDRGGEPGCVFADRCPQVMAACRQSRPSLLATDSDRAAACHLYDDAEALSDERLAVMSCGHG